MLSLASISVAARRRVLPRIGGISLELAATALFVGFLVAFSLYVRTRAIDASYWMDEGLSIGIASHAFLDIPGVLRQDGSPPFYYMLLNVWMELFGSGEAATHALSLIVALLTIPAGLWAGWSLFGRRAGLVCAGLCCLNPFLTAYAQETRMYALMVLLGLVATAAHIHAFVYGRRRYLVLLAGSLALLLYSHNWGLFFTFGALVALVPVLLETDDRRRLLRDGALAFGGAGLLFAPWLPTLAFQAAHTGAPWVQAPRFGAPIQISRKLLGGDQVTVALLLAGGSGLAGVLGRRGSRERTAVIVALLLPTATLAAAWLFSQFSPAWTTRYFATVLGPILLVAAAGLAKAGRMGLVALAIVVFFWFYPRSYGLKNKSNAESVAVQVQDQLRPGDLVISTHPEQLPLINHYMPPGLEYGTLLGAAPDPAVMDWRDAVERLERARPETNLKPLLDRLPPGGRVLLVRPITQNTADWDAPWTQLVRRRSAQWGGALAADKRFVRTRVIPQLYRRASRIGVRAVLYTKSTT